MSLCVLSKTPTKRILHLTNSKEKETFDNKLSFNNHIKTAGKSVEKLIRKSVLPPG